MVDLEKEKSLCITIIPATPNIPPSKAKYTLSGKLFLIPIWVRSIWKINVNKILDDAIVDVNDAPIRLIPSTYNIVPIKGNNENVINIYQYDDIILKDISELKINITVIKIKPDNNKHFPEISNGE